MRDRAERDIDVTGFHCDSSYVSNSENLAARLHVDLRRQASAICAVGR
ncbi:putative leader peptide [Streptomyces sporangiiformans]|nr:putative leader peptide [Streptomyces sporangiiformans]